MCSLQRGQKAVMSCWGTAWLISHSSHFSSGSELRRNAALGTILPLCWQRYPNSSILNMGFLGDDYEDQQPRSYLGVSWQWLGTVMWAGSILLAAALGKV